MTVTLDEATPEAAARQLGIAAHHIDRAFGVVPLDPDRNLFAVRIPQHAVPAARPGESFRGPFADPRIGVPTPDKKPDQD
jgi:hypothetical protein